MAKQAKNEQNKITNLIAKLQSNTGYGEGLTAQNEFRGRVLSKAKAIETGNVAVINYNKLLDVTGQNNNQILKQELKNKPDIEKYLNKVIELSMDAKNKITDIMLNTIILKKLKENIDNKEEIGTTFDVSYNGIVKQVSYTKDDDVKKSFSFTEPSSDGSKKDFTVDNIKTIFVGTSQGGKKHNIKKTTLKKRGGKYNKKRYTMRKKKITRNKIKSRTRTRSRSTKTKKQKRRSKKPRYTKRRY